jgi:hypothetical protein
MDSAPVPAAFFDSAARVLACGALAAINPLHRQEEESDETGCKCTLIFLGLHYSFSKETKSKAYGDALLAYLDQYRRRTAVGIQSPRAAARGRRARKRVWRNSETPKCPAGFSGVPARALCPHRGFSGVDGMRDEGRYTLLQIATVGGRASAPLLIH